MSSDLRAITVKQPYCWAIAVGIKDVENRSRPVSYRGPLAIHAGVSWSHRGAVDPRIQAAWGEALYGVGTTTAPTTAAMPTPDFFATAAILAVAQLADVHEAVIGPHGACCPPWGAGTYDTAGFGPPPLPAPAEPARGIAVWHYRLTDIRPLPVPVPAVGRLGLWRPDPAQAAAITAALTQPVGTR